MDSKLQEEKREDQVLKDRLQKLDNSISPAESGNEFDYIRNIIDERTALIQQYE